MIPLEVSNTNSNVHVAYLVLEDLGNELWRLE